MIKIKKTIRTFEQLAAIASEITKLLVQDKKLKIYVLEKKPIRSIPQNKYYRGVVVKLISDTTGYSTDKIHEILKYKFNSEEVIEKSGEVYKIGKTTTKLNKEEFSVYLENCINWANEVLNLDIPSPDDLTEEQKEVLLIDELNKI